MTIGKKIAVGFAATVTVTAAQGIFTYTRLTAVRSNVESVSDDAMPSVRVLRTLDADTQECRGKTFMRIAYTDPQQQADMDKSLADVDTQIAKDFSDYEPLQDAGEDTQLFAEAKANWAKFTPVRQQMIEMSQKGDRKGAGDLFAKTGSELFENFGSVLDKMVAENQQHGDDEAAKAKANVAGTLKVVIYGLTLAVLLAVTIGTFITVGTRP